MKNALLLITMLALLCACSTTDTGSDPNARIRTEVAGWTADFATFALIAKPEYRPALEGALRALDSAEGAGGINLDSITAALFHVEGLQSTDSKLALIGGRLILRRAFGGITLETPDAISAAGLGLRDGLKTALAVP